MASHRSPAARANHHAHFRQRIPNPNSENVPPNAKRQNNPFDVFTSVLFGGNDNPRHQHKTVVTPVSPKSIPPVAAPSPPPPVLSKPPTVEPSVPVLSDIPPPVVTPNPPTPTPKGISTSAPVHSKAAATSATHAASASASQGIKSANSTGASTSTTSPSSAGVIVGVVIAVVGIIALLTVAWFIRKRKIAQRDKMRKSWTAGLGLGGGKSWTQEDTSARTNLMSERSPETPSFNKPLPDPNHRVSLLGTAQTSEIVTPPPNILNNPATFGMPPTIDVRTGGMQTRSGQEGESATVKRGFIPSLPDELPVNIGDTVGIVMTYDDGWCLCCNALGDRGMVPLECLNRTSSAGHTLGSHIEMERQDARNDQNRMSRRASSLYVGVVPQDGY